MRALLIASILAALAGCATRSPRPGVVGRVEFLPEMWCESQARARVLYQDGALATPVLGGTLWSFGDTFMGTRRPDGSPNYQGGALSNTLAFLPAGERSYPPRLAYLAGPDGVARPPLALLPDEDPATRRLWPLAGVWLRPDRGYLFYGLIDIIGPGPWGFKPVGVGLARAPSPMGPYERLPQPPGGWPIDASAVVRDRGMLYLYAPRRFKGERDFASGLLVARVPEGDIEHPGAYEFFAGLGPSGAPRWTATAADAREAADHVWGQASVAWNPYLRAYLLATSANLFEPDRVRLRQGPTPWGPWTPLGEGPDAGVLRVPERPGETTELIYCAELHPELDADGGRVITLTFCRMLRREWAFTNPEGVRVDLGVAAGGH
jgi:hypothetical protein